RHAGEGRHPVVEASRPRAGTRIQTGPRPLPGRRRSDYQRMIKTAGNITTTLLSRKRGAAEREKSESEHGLCLWRADTQIIVSGKASGVSVMRTIQSWLDEYGESHRTAINKRFHWVCVPLIMLALVVLFSAIPRPAAFAPSPWMHWGTALVIVSLLYY